MVAFFDWPLALPQAMLIQGQRTAPAPQLVDRFESVPPIYFTRAKTKLRRVSGTLRLSFPQRALFLQLEPSFRGQRFNADFEGLGSTRETIIDDWSIAPTQNGTGFQLSLSLTVFDVGQLVTLLDPEGGIGAFIGNVPVLV